MHQRFPAPLQYGDLRALGHPVPRAHQGLHRGGGKGRKGGAGLRGRSFIAVALQALPGAGMAAGTRAINMRCSRTSARARLRSASACRT